MHLVMIAATRGSCISTLLRIPSVRIALYIIPLLLWLVIIPAELRNCPVLGTTSFGILPMCSVVYPN